MDKPPIILWIILVLLLTMVYIWSAVSPSTDDEVVIVQTPLASFTPLLLNEKNPVLISDRIVNIDELISVAFKFTSHSQVQSRGQKVKSSYAIFHPKTDITITIKKPKTLQEVDVIVPANNVFILPMWWEWKESKEKIKIPVTNVNTIIGALCGILL